MISGFHWPDRLRNVSIESALYLMSSAVLLFCDNPNDHVETREPLIRIYKRKNRRKYYMKKNYLGHLLPCCSN